MKKYFPLFLALFMLMALAGCSHVSNLTDRALERIGWRASFEEQGDPGLTKRTVIAPFRYGKPDLAPQAKALQQAVENALHEHPHIKLVDFRELQKASLEYGFAELVSEDRYLTGARHLGINLIVVGDISGMYIDYNLMGWYGFRESHPQLTLEGQIRMVDGVRGTVHRYRNFKEVITIDDVEAQAIMTGRAPEKEMIEQLTNAIIANNLPFIMEDIDALPWSGMVLKVEGSKVLVTGGQDTGFGPGDTLVLYSQSDRITTGGGHSIYMLGQPVGTVTLSEIMPDTSWGEVNFDQVEQDDIDVEGEEAEDNEWLEPKPDAFVYDVQPGQIVRVR